MTDPAERRIGNVIAGKWRVDSLLGSGSMAAVYAVTHRNGARAALKILHPTLCADEGICERFLGEGYLTNSVKHVGIVRVLDDGVTEDGCVFLVMDLLEGKTLEALRQDRGGQIPLLEILDIADKLMDVLHAVHEAGIIHRDLKPQNVFVCHDGSVKLLDFGVARVFDSSAQSKLSMFGLVLGTPSFMSPEQALGSRDKVDHRSDIWSLGATLFTAISGQTVHLGPHVQAKLLAAATVKARSITMVKQDLPAPIAAAIDTSLRFKTEERWQSVDAFRRSLREARLHAGLGKPQSVPPPGWLDDVSMDLDATQLDTSGGPVAIPNDAFQPGLIEEGPGGTLIGGTGTVPHMPVAPQTSSDAVAPAAQRPPPPPVVIRPPIDAYRESRPEGQTDGSYPAVGGTLDRRPLTAQIDSPRSSSAGIWIVGCLLAVAAAAGIAFFAVNRQTLSDAQGATSAQTPLTSATAPISTPPATSIPTAMATQAPAPIPTPQIDPKELLRDAGVAIESPIKASVTTPPSLRTGHAAQPPVVRTPPRIRTPEPSVRPESADSERPTTTQDAPPASIPTTLPPDPFGTPE
jgi:eukaryotic-like serine/threonine-protein kinase